MFNQLINIIENDTLCKLSPFALKVLKENFRVVVEIKEEDGESANLREVAEMIMDFSQYNSDEITSTLTSKKIETDKRIKANNDVYDVLNHLILQELI
jgi:hypothetical protein